MTFRLVKTNKQKRGDYKEPTKRLCELPKECYNFRPQTGPTQEGGGKGKKKRIKMKEERIKIVRAFALTERIKNKKFIE